MTEIKDAGLVPLSESEGTKKTPLRKICVKLYFNEPEFLEVVKDAEEAGTRARGLKPFRVKPHGFSDERIANTKGIVKLIKKKALPNWREGAAARKARLAELQAQAAELGATVEVPRS